MDPTDLTVEILKDIRSELRSTNQRLDGTNHRLDETRAELSQRVDAVVDGQVRLATEVVALASAVSEVATLLKEDRIVRNRVDDHERRIAAIERRAG